MSQWKLIIGVVSRVISATESELKESNISITFRLQLGLRHSRSSKIQIVGVGSISGRIDQSKYKVCKVISWGKVCNPNLVSKVLLALSLRREGRREFWERGWCNSRCGFRFLSTSPIKLKKEPVRVLFFSFRSYCSSSIDSQGRLFLFWHKNGAILFEGGDYIKYCSLEVVP